MSKTLKEIVLYSLHKPIEEAIDFGPDMWRVLDHYNRDLFRYRVNKHKMRQNHWQFMKKGTILVYENTWSAGRYISRICGVYNVASANHQFVEVCSFVDTKIDYERFN